MKITLLNLIVCTQFVLGTITLNAQTIENKNVLKTKIDSYLNASVANGFSGAVLVSIKGELILSKGYGWADRKNKIPNTSSTVFNIGSVSKQFTASAILKLVEQGKIKTSDKISLFYNQAPIDKKDITIHQLLTHTSGISPRTGGFRYDEADKEQFINDFFESELQSKPGTKHQYANANYIILTAILEFVSKQSYASFLNENLFAPSNMEYTGYKSITFSTEKLAHGYYYNIGDEQWLDWGTTQEHLPYTNKHWYSIGKGDIHSSIEDLYLWHLSLKNNKALKAESKEIQETPHVAENENMTSYYGYGWAISKSDRNTKIVTHNGSNGIFFADFIRFIDDDVVIIYLSNAFLGNDSEDVAWEISKMVFNSNYDATPLSVNIYEFIHGFMKINNPKDATKLPAFVKKQLGLDFNDPAILNRIGYKKMEKEKEAGWALELFKLNVRLFPENGNLWDSLGEAYLKYGQNDQAIKSYTKAVNMGSEGSVKILNKLLKEK
ncbi:MAG: serine hydrolase [Bacteroidales bacterium]|nr:serine hydrolase [Bacteroidales bacterium]